MVFVDAEHYRSGMFQLECTSNVAPPESTMRLRRHPAAQLARAVQAQLLEAPVDADAAAKAAAPAPDTQKPVLNELLTTETAYMASLNILMEVFRKPLMASGLITSAHEKALFGNVDELIVLHQPLLEAVRTQAERTDCERREIGRVFRDFCSAKCAEAYAKYCAGHQKALTLLRELVDTDDAVALFVHEQGD